MKKKTSSNTIVKNNKVLSVVVPVYNEEKTVGVVIKKVFDVKYPKGWKMQMIVVNDASTDETYKKLQQLKTKYGFVLLNHKTNSGKSSALRTGFKEAIGEVVVVQDGDLEYDPNDFVKMLKLFSNKKVKVVYGSRRLDKTNTQYSGLGFYIGGVFLTNLVNMLYGSNITDEPTCYKMFDAGLLKSIPIKAKRFEFCPEITAKVLKKGERIYEVPITYKPRHVDEGKKIKMKDFFEAVWVIVQNRFV